MNVPRVPPALRGDTQLAIVGSFDGTHIGGSLVRAARALGTEPRTFDVARALQGPRLLRAVSWHILGRRPLHLNRFSESVAAACPSGTVLLTTGIAPVMRSGLEQLRSRGVVCINYSTDDPWNRVHRAAWHLDALPLYDVVFTPRLSNMPDFRHLGCHAVEYLPFGYDPDLFGEASDTQATPSHDVLYVGGADDDRVLFIRGLMAKGVTVTLVGGYWERYADMREHALGLQPPEALRRLTAVAKVNLCLVRRANRDGHVMRSFEAAAVGATMLVEDTQEHRKLFGDDGECVRYFGSVDEAATVAAELLRDAGQRARLRSAVRRRITTGGHTYGDRLRAMLEAVASLRDQHAGH